MTATPGRPRPMPSPGVVAGLAALLPKGSGPYWPAYIKPGAVKPLED